MRDPRASYALMLLIMASITAGALIYGLSPTGYTVLDDAKVSADKEIYVVGEMAHISVTPDDLGYSIEVYGPDDMLVAISTDFPVEKPGKYRIEALLSAPNETRKVSGKFEVVEEGEGEEREEESRDNAGDNIISGNITSDEKIHDIKQKAKEEQVAANVNDKLKDSSNDTVGKKIKDDGSYETFFTFIGKVDGNLAVSFYHNATTVLPIWVEGISDYNLTSLSADPFEVINLTVPLDNGQIPRFKLHVGPDSDVFEFGIDVINLKSYPQVGGYWTVEFNTTGTSNLTITAVEGASFGEDLEFVELRCGDAVLDADYDGTRVSYPDYSCDQIGSEKSRVITSGEHMLLFQFGDASATAQNYATNYVCNGCADAYTTLYGCMNDINNTDAGCFLNESNVVYEMNTDFSYHFPLSSMAEAVIKINATNVTVDCNGSIINGNQVGYGLFSSNFSNFTIKNCWISNFSRGIYISNASYVNISSSIIFNNTEYGVYLENITLSVMENNTVINSSAGILLNGSSNNTISNNRASNNSLYGFYLFRSVNNTIINSLAFNNSRDGIYLYSGSDGNILKNNTVSNNTASGIFIYYNCGNSTLLENRLDNNREKGINLNYTSNITLVNNTINRSSQYGIYLYDSNNTNITGNTISDTASGYSDIFINGSNNNVWLNNLYTYGVNDTQGANTTFCIWNEGNFYEENIAVSNIGNGTGANGTTIGGDCGQSSITYPANGTILLKETNTTTNVSWTRQSSQKSLNYSIYLVNSSGRFYVNRTSALSTIINFSLIKEDNYTLQIAPFDGIYNGTNKNISIKINSTLFLLFVNQTNPSGEIVNETVSIFKNQNLTIRVNVTEIGEAISSVWIIVWQTVASAGNILWQGLMSLIGGLWQVEVPVNASYPTYVNYTVFANDSTNKTVQIQGNFTVDGIALINCSLLNQANTTYILSSNVSASKTCMNITAWNVTLDCRGYTIDFANSKADNEYGIGVVSYKNRTTIKNCNISRDSIVGKYAYGILMWNSSYSEVVNNTINTVNEGDIGIYMYQTSYSNITNNTINTEGQSAQGIVIYLNSSYNNIKYNNITTNRTLSWGVYIYLAPHNNFTSNNITTRAVGAFSFYIPISGYGKSSDYEWYGNQSIDITNLAEGKPVNYTFNKSNLLITNVNFTKYGQVLFVNCTNINITNSAFSDDDLGVQYSSRFIISNNNFTTSNSDGIMFNRVFYSNVTNNSVNISSASGGGIGIVLYYASSNNGITNNTIFTSAREYGYGIHVSGGQNYTIENNTVLTSGSESPALFLESIRLGAVVKGGNYTTLNSSTYSNALYIGLNANASLYDVILDAKRSKDILLVASRSNINLTNCTVNTSDIDPGAAAYNAKINIFHYLDGQVNDSIGSMITGAAVLGYDVNNNFRFSTTTEAGGKIPRQNVLEYQQTASGSTFYTNYTVNASYLNGTNASGRFNISGNMNITLNLSNNAPTISYVILNATSASNATADNLTAYAYGENDPNGHSIVMNYNWIKNGISDTVLNLHFTKGDIRNQTYDLSGYGNHGNVSNSTAWNSTAGHDGFGAYDFDGVDDYILIPDNIDSSNSMDINKSTISMWIKIDSIKSNDNETLLHKDSAYYLQLNDNDIWLEFYGLSDGMPSTANDAADTNIWMHIAGVYNGTNVCLYKNGSLVDCDAATGTVATNNNHTGIGGRINESYPFDGTIDEVRIWNRSLSANEIAMLYNNITNTTHSSALTGGDNWTVKVTPIDSHGLNGSWNFSNSLNITHMLLTFINQTNRTGAIVNQTYPILANQNLTIRFNATNLGGSISTVWIIVWQTVASAGNILWQGLMSLIGGLWQVEVPVNESYPIYANYTVYANDTVNRTTQTEGNFTTKCRYCFVNSSGGDYASLADCLGSLNNTNDSSCILNEFNQTYSISAVTYNIFPTNNNATIRINASTVTLDCNYGKIIGSETGYGVFVDGVNNTIIRECYLYNYSQGILINGADNTTIQYNLMDYSVLSDLNITVTSNNSKISHNSFYSKGANNSGASNSFCVWDYLYGIIPTAVHGNLYEEKINRSYIENTLHDCGLLNITKPQEHVNYTNSINLTWSRQSTTSGDVNVSFSYSADSGLSWTHINSTSSGVYLWDISALASGNSYLINMRPYDTRHNATNATSYYFGIDNTPPSLFIINQTNSSNALLASSNPLKSGSSMTINVNASDVYGINSVWTDFWGNGTNSTSIWRTTLSRVGGTIYDGVWQVSITLNETFPEWGYINYTIYANDSTANSIFNNSNFSVVDNEYLCSDYLLCEYTTVSDALSGENNTNSTILVTGSNLRYNYTGSSGSYSLYPLHNRGAVEINASNITVDCGGSTISGNHQAYGVFSKGFGNMTLFDCRFGKHMTGLNISGSANDNLSFVWSYNNVNYGMYLTNFTNGNMNFVNISNNTKENIFMIKSNSTTIEKSNISYSSRAGINLTNSSFNTIKGIKAEFNNYSAVYIGPLSIRNLVANSTIINSTSSSLLTVYGSYNNVTGNHFDYVSVGYYALSIMNNALSNNIWLNNFYNGGAMNNGTGTSFCMNVPGHLTNGVYSSASSTKSVGNYYITTINSSYALKGTCGNFSEAFDDSDHDNFYSIIDDCDNLNKYSYPGATEECDDFDNNCDGQIDEGVCYVTFPSSGSGGAGSSGGGVAGYAVEGKSTQQDIITNPVVTLYRGETVSFIVKGTEQSLKLNKVYEDKVSVSMPSLEKDIVFNLNEPMMFDVDNDGTDDFEISLSSIIGASAVFNVRELTIEVRPEMPMTPEEMIKEEEARKKAEEAKKPAEETPSKLSVMSLMKRAFESLKGALKYIIIGSISLAILISVTAGAVSYSRFMGDVKRAEEYVGKALENRLPEAEIRQKLIESGWEPEIVDSIMKMELKMAEEKQLKENIEKEAKEGADREKIKEDLMDKGWKESDINEVMK